MRKIFVITGTRDKLSSVADKLQSGRARVEKSERIPEIPSEERSAVDTVVVDLNSLLGNSQSVDRALNDLYSKFPSASVVVLAGSDQSQKAVEAVKAGAFDYLTLPVGREELELVIEKARQADIRHSELDYLRDQFWGDEYKDVVNTKSRTMQEVLRKVRQVADTGTTVLLSGETGTGKSLIARLIHAHSGRRKKTFINVHCGAIPDSLVESELFGHEKGSFTGAIKRKIGKFELADSGTIFLDEIGTISSAVQIKLLNVLQERQVQRIGGESAIPLNVRVIAATNEDLGRMCADGKFRQDLFYRLNVFPIVLPPLRDRKEDILHLSRVFISSFNTDLNKNVDSISPEVLDAFMEYDWPGNVRELENVIERACILETGSQLTRASFPVEFFTDAAPRHHTDTEMPLGPARQAAIESFELDYLTRLLTSTGGRISPAASKAGITTRQLNKLMHKHGLDKKLFK
ncbi:sigma-54 dependent transcriptional regulator [Maridesulfovibrio sp.]|uniref:sigma-54 dependent transcriptional regulator n=1 Tax=Maridesulfovibrio sp. TaxID=2795000 RepID=UPI002A187402|nr:sigma-54 dependent transcriptional regulator [Maridesulfovibrio sp.]